jgi:hypothetical protein
MMRSLLFVAPEHVGFRDRPQLGLHAPGCAPALLRLGLTSASHPADVAGDWLTSACGQNAGNQEASARRGGGGNGGGEVATRFCRAWLSVISAPTGEADIDRSRKATCGR